jgi:hypothetical protein
MSIGQVLENNGWKRSSVKELRLFRKNGWEAYYCDDYLYLDHDLHGEHTVDLKDMNIKEVEEKFSISSEK